MSRSIFVIILVVALDAIGIGLIFPILPGLLKQLTGSAEISTTMASSWPPMRRCSLCSLPSWD